MKVSCLLQQSDFTAVNIADDQRQITGVYIGDLLSFVMGRAKENDAWITIMSNVNVAAVATLADTSVVILAEDVLPDKDLLDAASKKQINIIKTGLTAYETAVRLKTLFNE